MSISHLYPTISPSLSLNFARSKTLDPRITFTRTTAGTRTNELGLIEVVPANAPRFDHSYDPVSGSVRSLGLLIEEQRTNLFNRSDIEGNLGEDPIGAIIPYKENGQSMLVSNDVFIGPNGLSAKHTKGSQGDSNIGYYGYNHTSGDLNKVHTVSLYVYIPSSQASGFTSTTVMINVEGTGVTNLTPGYADHTITDKWQRITATYTPTSANFVGLVFRVNTSAGRYVYTDAWQLEQGSFVTSYMPSSGGSQFTRTVDAVSMTGTNFSSWFNQSEGTLFANFMGKTIRPSISFDRYIAIVGNDPNFDEMGFYTQTADGGGIYKKIAGFITNNTVGQISGVVSGGGPDFGGKAILAYKSNDASYTINGATPVTDNTVDLPTFVGLRIFGRARYQPEPSGHISQFIYYPKRLPDTQLINLTK